MAINEDTDELVAIAADEAPAAGLKEASARLALLINESMFDEAFYARQAGVSGSRAELIDHYMEIGEAALLSPSQNFDTAFYRSINPDVVQANISPLMHYLNYGRFEQRYANRMALRRDADLVAASGLFNSASYTWDRVRATFPGLSDIENYLAARDYLAPIGDAFDSQFYLNAYDDALSDYAVPILHYIHVGRAEHRVRNRRELDDAMRVESSGFNERFYLNQFPAGQAPGRPLEHYILVGSRTGLDPAPDFSTDYYLRRYPDIVTCGIRPFRHFVLHGRAEGRIGRPDFAPIIQQGEMLFDVSKPTILVASHEASRTGAPLVGLNVGERLSRSHNVVSYLGKPGPILPSFAASSCLVVSARLSSLDAEYLLIDLKATHNVAAVLLNSAETDAFAPAALQADLPSVALVHEFAEYIRPEGRASGLVELVDRVIAPAALIEESLQAELLLTRGSHANNIIVRHQGYLPQIPKGNLESAADLTGDDILDLIGARSGHKPKIVLGAGYVQMRKGVDLFVQTAAEVRRLHGDRCRFIWVGDGYRADGTDEYSTWVTSMVQRLDLKKHLFFLPAQSSLDTLFALSDVFYLPSRLDPFPNVVVDAFKAGRPVVCFEGATGSAELVTGRLGKGAAGAAVAYCNVMEAAAALVRFFRPSEAINGNAELVREAFDFDDYMAVIHQQLAIAAGLRSEAMQMTQAIMAAGEFDAAFHDNLSRPVDRRGTLAAIRTYVARGQKGLACNNPRPGFNEGAARSRLGLPGPGLAQNNHPATHRCVILPKTVTVAVPGLRVALHLHMHYPELAAEFAAKLSASPVKADLLVTTTSDTSRIEIEYAFRGYKGGRMQYVVVPNRGRDIGPFVGQAGAMVRSGNYDIIGHLHGKRSLAVSAQTGDRWRSYLVDTLLDGLPTILSLFEHDPLLGLVFAEDRHCVNWGMNQDIAAALIKRLQPPAILPDWPIFPIGTMFWARPAALAPLWSMALSERDFPAEPVAYDGTILHALERMLPSLCESTAHEWCTVYRQGAGW